MSQRVHVMLPVPFDHGFDYIVPAGMEAHMVPGRYVRVPFGRQHLTGVVWGEAKGDVAPEKLKSITECFDKAPIMPDALREFLAWVAWYNIAPLGAVLKLALPEVAWMGEGPRPAYLRIGKQNDAKLTPAQKRVVQQLQTPMGFGALQEAAHTTPKLLEGMLEQGLLEAAPQQDDAQPMRMELSPEQQTAADALRQRLGKGFSVNVLDGVTGSGKTEVYFDTIAATIAAGKQALVLLPEIALALPWVERFHKRFGEAPVVWHSGLTPAQRKAAWQRMFHGQAKLVVGARSALFLPHRNLGLIVVDEEHEQSYKQEDGVHYHARDMAVARAHHEKIPVMLVTATPSLETVHNIEQGRYAHVKLTTRYAAAQMPEVKLIDMREHKLPSGQFLSEPMRRELIKTLGAGHQALFFVNRRGYAPLTLCQTCGHRIACPQCSTWLVMHRKHPRLQCHHCGYSAQLPNTCPNCEQEETLKPFGPGAERIAEEIKTLMPDARIGMMTSDHVTTPAQIRTLIEAITEKKIDVMIGTQMIAKGHHFPHLAMVGVIDGDMGLAGSDFRASERTFQLLHQVAGRAGREHTKGEVFIQTFMPEHPVMQALMRLDRDGLLAAEVAERESAGWPPFGRLVGMVIEAPEMGAAQVAAQTLARHAPLTEGIRVLGPAPAPLSMLRGQYRFRLLVKAGKNVNLQSWIPSWLSQVKLPKNVKVRVDVDPQSFV